MKELTLELVKSTPPRTRRQANEHRAFLLKTIDTMALNAARIMESKERAWKAKAGKLANDLAEARAELKEAEKKIDTLADDVQRLSTADLERAERERNLTFWDRLRYAFTGRKG